MRRWLIIANVAAALGVSIAVDVLWPTAFSNAEQYFLGLLLFVALSLSELMIMAARIDENASMALSIKTQQLELWESRNDIDHRVNEVRRLFHALDEARSVPEDLFYQYHLSKLNALEKSMRDATVKQETQINENMFSVTDWLMKSSFRGGDCDLLRAVLPTSTLDFFFDVHTRMYFKDTFDHILASKCAGTKRLIVVDDPDHLTDPRLERLIAFHNLVDRYECRLIERVHFDRIVGDYKLQHLVVDFGIYGTTYVYKALTNTNSDIVGIYSRDPGEILQFTRCFDSCWEAGHGEATPTDPAIPTPPTIEWLFQV